MFVNKIAPLQFTKISDASAMQNRQNKTNPQNNISAQNYPAPTAAHYLSMLNFTGGSSVNLEESIENLDEYQQAHPDEKVYPPGVREAALELIDKGSTLTLIDVHKDVFEYIKKNEDLDKIKGYFAPLFDGVESAHHVEGRSDSLLERMKAGDLETFNPNNELSVDLLRLLYAEGLSTTDLKQYMKDEKHPDGVDVYHTVNKLGIPLLNPHYAHILKLSDREYNTRLIREIQKTKLERQGSPEPYIPRNHKPKQAESEIIATELAEHFVEKPDKIYSQKEDQQRFYAEHPEIAAKLSDLILVAWGEDKKSGLTAKMMKHFEKAGKKIEIQDLDPFEITPENAEVLKSFWEQNRWAVGSFSQKLKDLRAKEIYEKTPRTSNNGYLFKIFPSGLVVDFIAWKKKNGIFIQGFYNQFMEHDGSLKDEGKYKKTYDTMSKYFKDSRNSQVLTDTYAQLVQDFYNAIKNGELKDVAGILNTVETFMSSASGMRYDEQRGEMRQFIKANEIGGFYQTITSTLIKNGHKEGAKEALDFLYKKLDENYEIAKKKINDLPQKKVISPINTSQANKNRVLKTVPQGFLEGFEKWKKANNITQETVINPVLKKDRSFENIDSVENTTKIIARYCDENIAVQNAMADVYSLTLLDLYNQITKNRFKGSAQVDVAATLAILSIINEEVIQASFNKRLDEDTGEIRQYITTEEAGTAYQKVAMILIEAEKTDYLDFLYEKLDENYEKCSRAHGVK